MRQRQNRYTHRPHFRSMLRAACCACFAVVQLGCATMGVERLPSTQRVVGERMEPEPAKTLAVNVTQEGSVVLVDAQQKCALRRYDKIETTDHSTAVNKQPWVDWTLGVSGGTLLAIGGWTFADASNVYPDDTSSRTYNRVGPSTAKGIGVGTMVTGGALLGVAVVDALRAQGTTDGDPTVHERKGDLAGKCPSTPVAGVQIIGRFTQGGGNPITLGTTSSEGALELNLSEVPVPPNPPGDTDGEPYGPTLDVYVGDKIVGKVGLASVYPTWRQAWQSERAGEAQTRAEALARQRAQEAAAAAAAASRNRILEKLDRWAQSAVRASFLATIRHSETCFNRVDTEVACDSAAAFRKETRNWSENAARVTNGASRLTLTCEFKDRGAAFDEHVANALLGLLSTNARLAPTPNAAEIIHGKSHVFTSTSSGNAFVVTAWSGGSFNVACLAPLASVVEEAQLPQDTPDVFGGSGDTAAVAIMHDIAAQRSTYVYMLRGRSFFKKDAVWVEVR